MYNVKKQYTRPRPILYLYRDKPEISLVSNDFNTSKNITLNQQMNEVSTLEFEIPFTKERKLSVDDCEKLVKFEKEFYIIKTINTEDSETATMKVSCQHESTELKGVYCQYINLIGASPKEMFDKVMSSTMHPIDTGYKWAGTDVPNDKKRHLITENEQSVYQNLVAIAEVFNGWLEFWTDDDGQKWVYLRVNAINNKKFIKKGIDMKSLNITYSTEEIFTRLYPTGASDTITGQPINIMEVNPTKKSYVENYSYYIAKGIPTEVIDKEAKYQQLKTLNDSDYTDAKDLYNYALEELKKCCYPQLDAELTMQDLSVYVDSLDEPPKVGYEIKCIDKDIDFILVCRITGVERNYENPLETKITISNSIRYNTIFQDLEHSSNTTDKVVGGDEDGEYIPADKVKDGNHINIAYTLNDHTTQITETGEKIELVAKDNQDNKAELEIQKDKITSLVQDVSGNKAEIELQKDKITSLVQDISGNKAEIELQKGQITSLVQDVSGNKAEIELQKGQITSLVQDISGNKSQITQLSGEISSKVSKGKEFSSEMKQNASAFRFLFGDVTDDVMTIDGDGITVENDDGSYTRISSKGIMNLSSSSSSHGKPYHYLQYTDSRDYSRSGSGTYKESVETLPSMFDELDSDNMSVSVSIEKVYKEGYYLPYWFGCYGEVTGGEGDRKKLRISHMSAWREVEMDSSNEWVADIGGKSAGGIVVRYTIIA